MIRFASTLVGLVLILGTLGVAPVPPEDSPSLLLVANKEANSLYFVNAATLQVEDSVATGKAPHEVAAAPNRGRAYVANYGAGTISVVNVPDRRIATTWPLDGYARPHGIAVGPTEEHVYVTAEDAKAVLELNAATGTVERTFKTGKEGTHMLALSPDGGTLYATSIGSGTLSIVNLESGTVRSHLQTGRGAEGVAAQPNGRTVWVTNRADDTVSIIEPNGQTITDTLSVRGFPIRAAFQHEGGRAVVSTPRAGGVVVIDTDNRSNQTRLKTGAKPIGVLASPQSSRAFVANAGSQMVSVIDLAGPTVTDTIRVGKGPDGMAFVPVE